MVKIVLDKYCPNLKKHFGFLSFISDYFYSACCDGKFKVFRFWSVRIQFWQKPKVLKYAFGIIKQSIKTDMASF
ncbi:hypothetical protein BTO04_12630 [Polaribacter sp. SA4-10]|nr:hypothetical protein BTO04_12630 [Polaribacter sp. SA4-10]